MEHELKIHPPQLYSVIQEYKRAEFRKMDRPFKVGDSLYLRGWDPVSKEYIGQYCRVNILDIETGAQFGIPEGYGMLSIRLTAWGCDGKRGQS